MQAYRKAKPKQGHNRIVALRGSKPPQSMSGFSMDPKPATDAALGDRLTLWTTTGYPDDMRIKSWVENFMDDF